VDVERGHLQAVVYPEFACRNSTGHSINGSRSMLSRRKLLSAAMASSAFSFGLAARASKAADDYPNRVIHLIVGYATGGNVDIPARLFAPELQRILGQPVIIENRPGASGVPASEAVSRAAADGYTIIWGTSASHSVSVVAMAPLSFDPVKDFAPITLISEDPNVIIAANSFPAADSIEAFLAYVKAHPGTPIGTAGPATSGRFAVALMKPKIGVELTVVPYKSTGPLLTDLAGNHIPLGITAASTAVPFIKEKTIRAIAMTSLKRSRVLPDVPTFDETVSKGFDAVAWSALFAPPGTPDPIIRKLNAAMKAVSELPAIKKWFDESGLEVPMSSPEELTSFMKADIEKWVQVAKDNDLKIDMR
jgi:tripartite-type tricarboxylate transporter receptor subunit TctC